MPELTWYTHRDQYSPLVMVCFHICYQWYCNAIFWICFYSSPNIRTWWVQSSHGTNNVWWFPGTYSSTYHTRQPFPIRRQWFYSTRLVWGKFGKKIFVLLEICNHKILSISNQANVPFRLLIWWIRFTFTNLLCVNVPLKSRLCIIFVGFFPSSHSSQMNYFGKMLARQQSLNQTELWILIRKWFG